ncbi:MAG: hypothetical protein ACR2QW_02205 [bacterium]
MLNARDVNNIFLYARVRPGESCASTVVYGIAFHTRFENQRIEHHREQIENLFDQLPDCYHERSGSGWRFLEMNRDRYGNQWTNNHITLDRLIQLGIGTGKVTLVKPRGLLLDYMPNVLILDHPVLVA